MRGPNSLSGLRTEVREFMRCCETLLSRAAQDTLTEDETAVVRYYVQSLTEQCGSPTPSDMTSLAPRTLGCPLRHRPVSQDPRSTLG